MTRAILTVLLSLFLCSCASWPGKRYPDVRAYAYNLKGEGPKSIIDDGKLSKTATSKTGVLLTPQQVQRFIAAVTGKHRSHPHAACFTPRHAFVFYDATHTPRAWVEVCFECLNNRSDPQGIADDADFPALAELCAELRLPASPSSDFRNRFDEFRREMSKPQRASVSPVPGLDPIPTPQ